MPHMRKAEAAFGVIFVYLMEIYSRIWYPVERAGAAALYGCKPAILTLYLSAGQTLKATLHGTMMMSRCDDIG